MIERFIHHKRLILHYYLVALLISMLFWWWARHSVTFMEDLRKHKRRVILVAEDISSEGKDYLEDLKIVVIRPNEDEENVYTKCGLDRASNVILLHEKDTDNLNEFMEIDYYFEKRPKRQQVFSLFIHIQEVISRRLFTELEEDRGGIERPFHVRIINLYDLFADHLFSTYPIYRQDDMKKSLHLLIMGFGSMGQHIALKAITKVKEMDNNPMLVTALDKHMNKLIPGWEQQNSHITSQAAISLQNFDIESGILESIISNQEVPITHIYICLDEDYLDVLAGIELSSKFPTTPIFIEFPKNSMAGKWIRSEVSGTRLIYSTGTYEDVLTEEQLLGRNKS